MSVGRNESCPCGSGKKYKKCCGVVTSLEEVRTIREQKMKKEVHATLERLNKFVASHYSAETLQEARIRFAGLVGLSHEEVVSSEWVMHFYNWYLFDAKDKGSSVRERFFQEMGKKLGPELHRLFEQVRLGVYEVEGTDHPEELTVRDLATGEQRKVLAIPGLSLQAGQILLGRLVSLGLRDLPLAGSIILQPRLKQAIQNCLANLDQAQEPSIELYKVVIQSGKDQPASSDKLLRMVYGNIDLADMQQRLQTHPSFELKKRDSARDVWIYSRRKEAHLFPALHNTLLELHEVGGEVLLEDDTLSIEALQSRLDEIAEALEMTEAGERTGIDRLTSTGAKLLAGTLFITSEPTLPSKVLQWAVQTYFAEKWLLTPHAVLNQLPPLLAAAANDEAMREALLQLVETIEAEGKQGHGVARFMRVDLLRPRLSLANSQIHIENLLQRPVIDGMPEAEFTVAPELLADVTSFVSEMTEGKSEATVKKYDEVMNLFRSFIRGAFGPTFAWAHLRREEVAYFLVQEIPRRADSLTKTLATNVLSVLAAFFKWLDKREKTFLADSLLPLLTEIKDDLPEVYRLRSVLQKEANHNLFAPSIAPREVQELHLPLVEQQKTGWLGKGTNEESLFLQLPEEASEALAADWIIAGLVGKPVDGQWHLYGTPELYPPVISELLGIRRSVLV